MNAGWRTTKRQTARLRAVKQREDTRAATGLGGGEGRDRLASNPSPPGGDGQSGSLRKLTARLLVARRSVALAALKEAESESESETLLEDVVLEPGLLKRLALGIFRRSQPPSKGFVIPGLTLCSKDGERNGPTSWSSGTLPHLPRCKRWFPNLRLWKKLFCQRLKKRKPARRKRANSRMLTQ